jgi:hypothetical protein
MLYVARAKALAVGLVRGKGTYNGRPYWVNPRTGAIVSPADLLNAY